MIVEDGTGLKDSNSYVDVAFADDYFTSRGNTEWAELSETQKESLLINATDFIDNSFQWYGKKSSAEQSLRFPRKELTDYEGLEIVGIPASIKQSVCDSALLLLQGKVLFNSVGEKGAVTSEKIGELSFTYATKDNGDVNRITNYDIINTKLRGLFKPQRKNGVLVGKVERV